MMKFVRPSAPEILQKNYKKWGHELFAKRKGTPNARFVWKRINGEPINRLLNLILTKATKDHCSFCDGYPLGQFARPTIEHFRPISKFPRLSYAWANLFLCCDRCQEAKGNKFSRKLLKPDVEEYNFARYFILNYKSGEVEVNLQASTKDQERAQMTIKMYGLNRFGRPQSRLKQLQDFDKRVPNDYVLDDFPYRFFLA